MQALYIIGEPGVGKSTLAAHLTRALPYEDTDSPFAMRRYDCGVLELGGHRRDYPGTDTLSLSVQPKVLEFLEGYRTPWLFGEGDRLANRKFLTALVDLGYDVTVLALVGSAVAERQRKIRGSKQDETWLKGRQTKVRGLFEGPWTLRTLPAGMKLALYEAELLDVPVAASLIGARTPSAVPA